MVLYIDCYVVFHFLMVSLKRYVGLRYIQLSLGNRIATFLEKNCHLFLSSGNFVAAYLYLSAFSFGVGDVMLS